MLYNGVLDVLAGPSQPGLQQHLSPRVQRALRASTLQPQQLAGWLDSTVAAARTLFHLKGELRMLCTGYTVASIAVACMQGYASV